jgi:hypothetical protein
MKSSRLIARVLIISREVEPNDSIFDLEERYGTLAYAIFLNNPHFHSFRNLFVRKNKTTIKIPYSFLSFELSLDMTTKLPKKFTLYHGGKMIVDYEFSDTQVIQQ